jgi:phosphoglycolate phosphatase
VRLSRVSRLRRTTDSAGATAASRLQHGGGTAAARRRHGALHSGYSRCMAASLVVFDLDGTLIDSAADLAAAVNRMLARFAARPLALAEVRRMIGDGTSALVARALAARGRDGVDAAEAHRLFLEYYAAQATVRTRAYPGVRRALEALGAALGLAECFARVVGGDSLPWRKPDPRVLLSVLADFDAAPASTLMVGDSEVDAATASAAGVPLVLMKHGYHRGPLEAIRCVAALEAFDELPRFALEYSAPTGG